MKPTETTLKELLLEHRRKQNLSRLYDQQKLPFHKTEEGTLACDDCHKRAEWIAEVRVKDAQGVYQPIPAHWEGIDLIEIDDLHLCRLCFCVRYYVGLAPHAPSVGQIHPNTPRSERDYDGGRFNAGEW